MKSACVHLCRFRLWVGLVLLSIPGGCGPGGRNQPELEFQPPERASEVKTVLEKKTALVEELAGDERILAAVRAANAERSRLSNRDIASMDTRWKAAEATVDFVKPFLTSPCARALGAFQEAHDEFPEILVTDARGLIVAATNKSSDFLQADEAWWVETFKRGGRGGWTGPIEYDESTGSEAISVYVPLIDAKDAVIGVIKAVCDLNAIKREL